MAIESRPELASSDTGQSARARHHEAQGAGPEGPGQRLRLRAEITQREGRLGVRHMGDERVEGGPALGGIDAGHRLAIGGVGAEAVDGLGREGDEPALAQGLCGGVDVVVGGHARLYSSPPRKRLERGHDHPAFHASLLAPPRDAQWPPGTGRPHQGGEPDPRQRPLQGPGRAARRRWAATRTSCAPTPMSTSSASAPWRPPRAWNISTPIPSCPPGLARGGAARRGGSHRRGGRRVPGRGRQRVLRAAAARPPCRDAPRHGLLPVQPGRHRRALRAPPL